MHVGHKIALDLVASADAKDPVESGVKKYQVMGGKVLPLGPPHPFLLIQDIADGASVRADSGSWLYTAITPRVCADPTADLSSADLLITFLNSREGAEDAVNEWFEREHLPDLLAMPGFLAGQRFQADEGQTLSFRYLNLWTVDAQTAQRSLQAQRAEREEAERAGRPPKVRVHPALIADQRMGGLFRLLVPEPVRSSSDEPQPA